MLSPVIRHIKRRILKITCSQGKSKTKQLPYNFIPK